MAALLLSLIVAPALATAAALPSSTGGTAIPLLRRDDHLLQSRTESPTGVADLSLLQAEAQRLKVRLSVFSVETLPVIDILAPSFPAQVRREFGLAFETRQQEGHRIHRSD